MWTEESSMTSSVEQIKSQARGLTIAERADLAYYLITTLDEPVDDGAKEEWDSEIDRRMTDVLSGTATGHSIEEVLAEMRERCP
jgi:putative addiction module component (TIGR02574 family)